MQAEDRPPPYAPVATPVAEPVAQPVQPVMAQPVVPDPYGQPQYGQPQYGQPAVIVHRSSNQNKCCIMVTVAICVFIGLGFVAGGGTCVGIGNAQQEELETLNAETDFMLLPETCKILEIEYCWRTEWRDEGGGSSGNKRRKPYCIETWQPTFKYQNAAYDGEIEEKESDHDCGGGCGSDEGKDISPKFSIGEEPECWQTTAPGGRDATSDVYYCENDPCIKLWDPQFDLDSRAASSAILIIIGAVLLALGFAGIFFTITCGWCCLKRA